MVDCNAIGKGGGVDVLLEGKIVLTILLLLLLLLLLSLLLEGLIVLIRLRANDECGDDCCSRLDEDDG